MLLKVFTECISECSANLNMKAFCYEVRNCNTIDCVTLPVVIIRRFSAAQLSDGVCDMAEQSSLLVKPSSA